MTEKYINEPQLQIGMTQYNQNMISGAPVWTQNGSFVGTVTYVSDNKDGNGEQVYAVVEDPNLPKDQVTEVTVLFRGSTGMDQVFKQPKDVWDDWVENDLPIARSILSSSVKQKMDNNLISRVLADGVFTNGRGFSSGRYGPTGQLVQSSQALQQIMSDYPNAKINGYGHSLGSMDLQYALSQLSIEQVARINRVWLSNGPNIYSQLTLEEQAIVNLLKSRVDNYIDPRDIIGLGYLDGSLNAVGMVHLVDSKPVGAVNQHMTYGYQLDEDGKIKVLKTLETGPVNQVLVGMLEFQQYKTTLGVDGFSSSEKIFLDGEQARVVASGFSTLAELAHEQIEQAAKDAVAEAEELYQSLNEVPWGFFYLNPSDVQAAYAAGGVDYNTTVGKIEEYSQKKVSKSAEILASSKTLSENLLSGINQIEAQDQALSGIFGR